MKQLYETGDQVVINCDDRVIYTIVLIYGEGRSATCSYLDTKTNTDQELSIPIVALTKYVTKALPVAEKGKAIVKKDISNNHFMQMYM